MTDMRLDHIECADALTYLKTLPDACVNLCVTSPPYFGLRDYGTAEWDGGDPACDHVVGNARNDVSPERLAQRAAEYGTGQGAGSLVTPKQARDVCPKCGARRIDQQIGLEDTPAAYIARLVDVFREVKRVLRDDGSVYCNLGDSYGSGEVGRNDAVQGRKLDGRNVGKQRDENERQQARRANVLPPKSLMLIPHRFAIAMQDDGWVLREDIVWQKPNPMPESVKDRCTRAHEYIFHFTKQPRYWYDAQAVAEEAVEYAAFKRNSKKYLDNSAVDLKHNRYMQGEIGINPSRYAETGKRNRRSVWTINPASFKNAHFATFPEAIPEIIIQAACPEWCCEKCGAPYEAQVERESDWEARKANGAAIRGSSTNGHSGVLGRGPGVNHDMGTGAVRHNGYAPSCTCNAGKRAGVVLDPFMGAGTVALVAKRLNRRYVGCDLNADYVRMAERRIDSIPYTLFSLMEATGD